MLKSLPGQLPLVDGGATFSLARSDPFSGSALCLPPITHHFYFFFTSNWFFSFLFFWTLLHHPRVEKSALSSFSGFLSVPLSSAVSLLCFFPSLSLSHSANALVASFSYFSFISVLFTPFSIYLTVPISLSLLLYALLPFLYILHRPPFLSSLWL